MTHFSHLALTLCVIASLLVACSESFITTPDDAAMTVPGADALGSAFRGEVEAAPSWSDYEIAIETGVDRDSILAGEVVKVFCDITGLPDTTDKPALRWIGSHRPAEAQNEPVID